MSSLTATQLKTNEDKIKQNRYISFDNLLKTTSELNAHQHVINRTYVY